MNGKSIHILEKHGGRTYVSAIADTAAIRDYHELDIPGIEDTNALEGALAKAESELAQRLARAITSGITSADIHARLMDLVALLRVRVPAVKASIEAFLHNVVRSTGSILERAGELPPPPPGYEDVLRMENVSITISNWKILEFMVRMAADEGLFHILVTMQPAIRRAPAGTFFLACDQPVAVFHPTATPADSYGVGLADPATEVSMPLSSRVLLVLSWKPQPEVDRQATSAEIREFNRRTVVMADSLVFAETASEWVTDTVRRYSHCSAGVELDVIDLERGAVHLSRFRPVMHESQYDGR